MPILTGVGKKTLSARLVVLGIYALLVLAGITMVVPFLLTLTMSVSNEADLERYDLLPAFWWRDDLCFGKYLAEKYADLRFEVFASAYGVPEAWSSFKDLGLDPQWKVRIDQLKQRKPEQLERIAADYSEFTRGYSPGNTLPLFANWDRTNQQQFIRARYLKLAGDRQPTEEVALDLVSRQWNEGVFIGWDQIEFARERHYPYHMAGWVPPTGGRQADYDAYMESMPSTHKTPISTSYLWSLFLLERGVPIPAIDVKYGTHFGSLYRVPRGDAATLPMPLMEAWKLFKTTAWPHRLARGAEEEYQAFLARKYANVEAVNAAYGWKLPNLRAADLPMAEVDYQDYTIHSGTYFRRFVFGNFGVILDFVAGHGRSLWNTLFLVGLSVAATLTVNPLAAYALSRFRLKSTQQILVFLLSTMAFPAEVGMIPGFLLLRDLHLLNTFGALILPTVANGFSIFLLKGFFDSLPSELFEAAALDGAGEMTIFWRIAVPLSTPILAVIALNSFIAAYGGFMWAFLVAQDPNMWTLMVWLFQFQQTHANQPHLVIAAMVLASIPTLVVFMVCQKVILRGIVVPSMK